MADYYPLLARALEALPDRSPPMRKAVYDRARGALIGQLRSLDPPVAEADIELERQALDTAIGRLEADFGEPPPAEAAAVPDIPAPAPPPAPPVPAPEEAAPKAAIPEPTPPPPEPEAPATPPAQPAPAEVAPLPEASPEPGPRPDFLPFVPPRKAKPEPAPAANEDAAAVPPASEAPAAAPEPEVPNGRQRPRIDVVAPRKGRSRLLRNVFVGGVLALVIGLIAVAAFLLRDQPADLGQAGTSQENASEPPESKFADRVGGERPDADHRPAAPKPNLSPSDMTVAQRAVMLEENLSDPKATPSSTQGRAIWRLEPVNGEQGQPLQNAIRANVEFPDSGFALIMTIRKNLDATLPASHTIELLFNDTGSEEKRTVQEIGLLQLKDEENARGSPVSGLPVRVRDNFFLIGLSNLPNDVDRNTDMLTHKAWFDLAVKFKSGPRAVLTFNTGNSGAQVIQAAFDQWRQ